MAPRRRSGPCSRRDGVTRTPFHAGAVAAPVSAAPRLLPRIASSERMRVSFGSPGRADRVSRLEVKGPRFVRFFGPVIEVLKGLGGSGSPEEVRAEVASRLAISETEQDEQLPSGSSRFDNQVAWARFYLTRAGLLDSSRRGVWSLTEKGGARSTRPSRPSARRAPNQMRATNRSKSRPRRPQPGNRVHRITARVCWRS